MIDVTKETVVSLTEAASLLPRLRRGRKPHISCLYRWTTAGCRGVALESVQIGATRCTSVEAIQRFCARLTQPHARIPAQSSRAREHQIARAERELADAGI